MKQIIFFVFYILSSFIIAFLPYFLNQTFNLNIYDTYFVVEKNSFIWLSFLFFIPCLITYYLLRNFIDYRLGFLHILLKNLGIVIMILAVYNLANTLPRRYFTDEPWYENPYLIYYMPLVIILGFACFLINVSVGLTKFFKERRLKN